MHRLYLIFQQETRGKHIIMEKVLIIVISKDNKHSHLIGAIQSQP